ncbi:MAG: hypothetical protein ACLQSR_07920 [Limisphaerales bacterium]
MRASATNLETGPGLALISTKMPRAISALVAAKRSADGFCFLLSVFDRHPLTKLSRALDVPLSTLNSNPSQLLDSCNFPSFFVVLAFLGALRSPCFYTTRRSETF